MIKTITYPYPVKQLQLPNDISIAYMDEGKGAQTFVFIHGLANYSPVWKLQISELGKHARCIALDLPGNGLSSQGDYPYGVFFYAECVKLFCDELNLEHVTLVGHSMGGQIAIMLGLRYSSQFDRLVLLAPAGIEHFSSMDALLMQNMLGVGEFLYSDELHIQQAVSDSFYTSHAEKNNIISDLKAMLKQTNVKHWRQMSKASINSMLNEQVSGFLSELTIPVTLIFGDKDALIPNKLLHPGQSIATLIKHAAAMIPDVKTYLLKNAGHFVQIEKAAEVNNIIINKATA
ncbi:MAG: alpha/beta hydrolase [Bacteroidota bacterium]